MKRAMATASATSTNQSPRLNCFAYSTLPLMLSVALPKADRRASRRVGKWIFM